MTIAEMKTMLESINGFSNKVAYFCFPEGSAPALPFICFLAPRTSNFSADGIAYYTEDKFVIELYSKTRDLSSEALIEQKLKDNGLFWMKESTYLDDEKCFEVIYEL